MQIRLWETDRNRVEIIPSHLYEDFPSKVNTVLSLSCILARGQDIYLLTALIVFSRKLAVHSILFTYAGMV